jgi:hypothetical protein
MAASGEFFVEPPASGSAWIIGYMINLASVREKIARHAGVAGDYIDLKLAETFVESGQEALE